MMKLTTATTMLAAMLFAGSADTASAQGFGISFEKHKKGKHFSFNLGFEGERRYRGPRPFHRRAPIPTHVHCDACRRWIPGRVEIVTDRVWVPGHLDRVWVPPVYRKVGRHYDRDHNGRRGRHGAYGRRGFRGPRHGRVLVRPGYWRTIEHPGHYDYVQRTVQRPGRWEYVCGY